MQCQRVKKLQLPSNSTYKKHFKWGHIFSSVWKGAVLPCLSPYVNTSTGQLYTCPSHRGQSSESSYIPKWKKSSVAKCETLSASACVYSGCSASRHAIKWLVVGCVGKPKAPTVAGNYWTSKNHKPKCTITWTSQLAKNKTGKKSQMRAEFKLHNKEGFTYQKVRGHWPN